MGWAAKASASASALVPSVNWKLFGIAFIEGVGSAIGSVIVYGLIVVFVLNAYSGDRTPKENLQRVLQMRSTGGGSLVLQGGVPGIGGTTSAAAAYT
jgi:hypothetical protein